METSPMHSNRRQFLTGSVGTFAAMAGTACASNAHSSSPDHSQAGPLTADSCLDYGRSFICNSAAFNAVRFWVESRTTVIDDSTGDSTVFYQCGSCKSENTFAEKDLFQEDNYDFLPILGNDQWLIFRRRAGLNDNYREIRAAEDVWGEPILRLRHAERVTLLDTWPKIRDTTAAGIPIVSQTAIQDPDTGLRAIIECPVKTLNISLERQIYQVDTGPVAFPDLAKRHDTLLECLSLAFVAFNAPHFADFVVEQPTSVVEDEQEVCQVYHYSKPFSLPASNQLLALSPPELGAEPS